MIDDRRAKTQCGHRLVGDINIAANRATENGSRMSSGPAAEHRRTAFFADTMAVTRT
jgi:hypothetical protein